MGGLSEARDLAGVRRLGLLGGTFDPVHAGHLHAARAAQRAFDLDHVVFMPAARPPHKPLRRLSPAEDRMAMLLRAIAGEPSWSASVLELERGGPSYTIDTVRELPARFGLAPATEIHLVLGWDNLVGLERWREARELLERVQPVVVLRGSDEQGEHGVLEHLRRELGPALVARLERGLLRVDPRPVSSTDLRARIARGEDPGADLPAGVLEYARAKGIYSGAGRP